MTNDSAATFGSVSTERMPSTSVRAGVIVGNADRAMTFGVNWYVNRWAKLEFNVRIDREDCGG